MRRGGQVRTDEAPLTTIPWSQDCIRYEDRREIPCIEEHGAHAHSKRAVVSGSVSKWFSSSTHFPLFSCPVVVALPVPG